MSKAQLHNPILPRFSGCPIASAVQETFRNDRYTHRALVEVVALMRQHGDFVDANDKTLIRLKEIADEYPDVFASTDFLLGIPLGPRKTPFPFMCSDARSRSENNYEKAAPVDTLKVIVVLLVASSIIRFLENGGDLEEVSAELLRISQSLFVKKSAVSIATLDKESRRAFDKAVRNDPSLLGVLHTIETHRDDLGSRAAVTRLIRDLRSLSQKSAAPRGTDLESQQSYFAGQESSDEDQSQGEDYVADHGLSTAKIPRLRLAVDQGGPLWTPGRRHVLAKALRSALDGPIDCAASSDDQLVGVLCAYVIVVSLWLGKNPGEVWRYRIGSPLVCTESGTCLRRTHKRKGQFSAPEDAGEVPYLETVTDFTIEAPQWLHKIVLKLVQRGLRGRSVDGLLSERGIHVEAAVTRFLSEVSTANGISTFRRNGFAAQGALYQATNGVCPLLTYFCYGRLYELPVVKIHYAQMLSSDVEETALQTFCDFLEISREGSGASTRDRLLGAESMDPQYFRRGLATLFDDTQQAFEVAHKNPSIGNADYVLRLAIILKVICGPRGVNSPWEQLPTTSGCILGFVAPRDKAVTPVHDARLVPLPDLALFLLDQYLSYLQKLSDHPSTKRYEIGKRASNTLTAFRSFRKPSKPVLFLMSSSKTCEELTNAQIHTMLKEYVDCERRETRLQWALFLQSNHEHIEDEKKDGSGSRTKVMPALSPFLVEALLGHDMVGDPNFGERSSMTFNELSKQTLEKLNAYPVALGWVASNTLAPRSVLLENLFDRARLS